MDVTRLYAMVANGLYATLTIFNFCQNAWKAIQALVMMFHRRILYPSRVRGTWFYGPWSRWGCFLRLLCLSVNVLCSGLPIASVAEADDRTAALALLNTMPLFLGRLLRFTATTVGLSVQNDHSIHGISATVSVIFNAFHRVLSGHSDRTLLVNYASYIDSKSALLCGWIVRTSPPILSATDSAS